MEKKVEIWANSVKKLNAVAKQQPQSAYVVFTKSLQSEWTYVQRVITNSGELISPLKSVINEYFIPALFGSDVDTIESELFCRPIRVGRLGIHDPVKTSQINFTNSSNNFLLGWEFCIIRPAFCRKQYLKALNLT